MSYKFFLLTVIALAVPQQVSASERVSWTDRASEYWHSITSGWNTDAWKTSWDGLWNRVCPTPQADAPAHWYQALCSRVPLWQQLGAGLAGVVGFGWLYRNRVPAEKGGGAEENKVGFAVLLEDESGPEFDVREAVPEPIRLPIIQDPFVRSRIITRSDIMEGRALPVFQAAKKTFGLPEYLKFQEEGPFSQEILSAFPENWPAIDEEIVRHLVKEPVNMERPEESIAWQDSSYLAWFINILENNTSQRTFEALWSSDPSKRRLNDLMLKWSIEGAPAKIPATRKACSALAQLLYLTYMRHDSQLLAVKGNDILTGEIRARFATGSLLPGSVYIESLKEYKGRYSEAKEACTLAQEASLKNIRGTRDPKQPRGDMWKALIDVSKTRFITSENVLREKLAEVSKEPELAAVLDVYHHLPGAAQRDQSLVYAGYTLPLIRQSEMSLDEKNIGKYRDLLTDLNVRPEA